MRCHTIQVAGFLVFDLDPQANCSQMLLGYAALKSAKDAGRTLENWVVHQTQDNPSPSFAGCLHTDISSIEELRPNRQNGPVHKGQICLAPAVPKLRFAEMAFERKFFNEGDDARGRQQLAKSIRVGLDKLPRNYADIVIFDCPPAFSTLTQAALMVSDYVISPVTIQHVSQWSLTTFWQDGLDDQLNCLSKGKRSALFTMTTKMGAQEERKRVRNAIRNFTRENGHLMETEIPFSSRALSFANRPHINSHVTFNAKYGFALRSKVTRLGEEVLEIIKGLDNQGTH